jgi:hypothetical protein
MQIVMCNLQRKLILSLKQKQLAISEKTRKTLWARSGNRCAICKTELVLDKDSIDNLHLNLGEECHIISRQINGPRHISLKSFNYDNSDNLLLLCCNDHKAVDEQILKYPIGKLQEIKTNHELWVKQNLENNKNISINETTPNKFESIIDLVAKNHEKEFNLKSNQKFIATPEGLQKALSEAAFIKEHVKLLIRQMTLNAKEYKIYSTDNKFHICDIKFNGFSLLIQFYNKYYNSANDSYLRYALVKGYYDDNGQQDPFYPITLLKQVRLKFDFNESNQIGWKNIEGKKEFYQSKEITELWIERFLKIALNVKNN